VADHLAAAAAHEQIVRGLEAIPGVTSVGLSSSVTMDGLDSNDPVFVEDKPEAEGTIPPLRRYKWIGPGYFGTMGNPIVAGRDFTWQDLRSRTPVVIVSASLAREFWGSPGAALGRRIRNTPKNTWREVVGVAGDEHDDGVARPAPTMAYWPMVMNDFWDQELFVQRYMSYAIRSPRVRTGDFFGEVQRAVWAVNPNLPLARVTTLQDLYDESMAETQFALVILGIAAGVTLLLGLVGLYGVVAYTVAQRRREVGIRIALGAGVDTVRRMFVRHGLQLVAIGLVAGTVIAAMVTRVMTALLFGVSAVDPITYGAVALVLGTVALVAAWLPARQAARVDPAIALRAE
jgi:putative ABC transport system permease protein